MKRLKEIFAQVKTHIPEDAADRNALIWQLICYPPKIPLRLHQQELLDKADRFSLPVNDAYFAHKDLLFNGFKWGDGSRKILITHGWGSKAADLSDILTPLLNQNDVTILAFDAPGNGSSEGELSNLLLFIGAVKAVIARYGEPDILVGHSLGGMANAMALQDLDVTPLLLISITPLIRLKENFQATMTGADIPIAIQDEFLTSFETKFNMLAADFNLNGRYRSVNAPNHWLAYDACDQISPYSYMKEFLDRHPSIRNKGYDNAGHDRILKSPELINDIITQVKTALQSS